MIVSDVFASPFSHSISLNIVRVLADPDIDQTLLNVPALNAYQSKSFVGVTFRKSEANSHRRLSPEKGKKIKEAEDNPRKKRDAVMLHQK